MPNHLISESSPYLLQHAHNPVDWYPWGEVALELARHEDKPIFLSIGFSACHWCHVMERESFEDPSIAKILNSEFISIKVDREERPDLDNIYMTAVVAMTGQGGWPLSIFLTPEMKPFYGGTYFPLIPHYRMPSFSQVLKSIARVWQEDRKQLEQSAEKISAYIQAQSQNILINTIDIPNIEFSAVVNQISQSFDWKHGGWGNAPKFPNPMTIEFLLMLSERRIPIAMDMVNQTLMGMQRGGMFDLVNGGFHRYSTDESWCVPHFEKMLYDNAQLALVYLHAALLTGKDLYRSTCERILDFILRELSHPEGGFYSSLDADSEGIEGQFYTWQYEELERLLKDTPEKEAFFKRHHISPSGNFDGKIILQAFPTSEASPEDFQMIYDLLRRSRQGWSRPATDDKVILSWNALTCRALAEAAHYLDRPDYLQAAQKNAAFLLDRLYANGQLLRVWRLGESNNPALLEDYSALIIALVALYQADYNLRWLATAFELASVMLPIFSDPSGILYDTPPIFNDLLFRPSNPQDNATPSGGALAAMALLTLCHYTENKSWHDTALSMINRVVDSSLRYPLYYSFWLQVLYFEQTPVQQVALLYPIDDIHHRDFIKTINQVFTTQRISACSLFPPPPDAPELLQNRFLVNELPTLFICQGFACNRPITNQADITAALNL